MYLCDIFESKFLDDWEEALDKTWAATKPLFVTQYNKDNREFNRESKRTPYERSASFREIAAPAPQSIAHDSDKATYEAAIEYAQVLEEQTTVQATEILDLKSVSGTNTTVVSNFAASAVAAPSTASVNLTALQTMVAQLATTVATLSKNIVAGTSDVAIPTPAEEIEKCTCTQTQRHQQQDEPVGSK